MESDFVDWLRGRIADKPTVPVGIGDDAAVLDLSTRRCVVCTDMVMDGVDFILSECDPRLVGRKALAVNLSDIAAMAARPVAAVVSLAANRNTSIDVLKEVYEGLLELADAHGTAVIGGDTNSWDQPLAISITAFGEPASKGVLTRAAAQSGDAIVVTGKLGGSILGKHLDFTPRVEEALRLHAEYELHACMDISDGLSLDLHRMTRASGCGAILDLATIPISDAARQLSARSQDNLSPLEHALGDGEDFELILAVPAHEAERLVREQPLTIRLTRIGELIREDGLWHQDASGERVPLQPRGYEH
jgi:thiamine-monophosphate kinase